MLHKGTVPHEAEEESADENYEYEGEELSERIGLCFSLGNFLDHLLLTDIFFCLDYK